MLRCLGRTLLFSYTSHSVFNAGLCHGNLAPVARGALRAWHLDGQEQENSREAMEQQTVSMVRAGIAPPFERAPSPYLSPRSNQPDVSA